MLNFFSRIDENVVKIKGRVDDVINPKRSSGHPPNTEESRDSSVSGV
jgi:hypothetical protein